MADLADLALFDAGMGLLRADGVLVVYPDAEGLTPTNPDPPYVKVYPTIDRPSDAPENSLTGLSQQWTVRWNCHAIGENEYAAMAVGMRVRAALLDQRPAIAGRVCGLIREDQAYPPTRDDSTGRIVYDAVSVYQLMTMPG